MFRVITFILLIITLNGCTALKGRVTQFHTLDSLPRSFVVAPTLEQVESLEFKNYANLVKQELMGRGWRPAEPDSADVAIFLQYQISQGRNVVFSYPIFGQVPTGPSTTTGSITTIGNVSTVNLNTQQNTSTEIIGTGTGSQLEYDRALQVTMYALSSNSEKKKPERIYEGTIRSSGSTGDLSAVVPTLIRALFEEFPGVSGSSRKVIVTIK
jgi:hypothetical protein